MKSTRTILVLAVLLFIPACLSDLASASTRFHVGIGYGYPHYGWHGRHGRHHRWINGPWHRGRFGRASRYHYWRDDWCWPHTGFWADDWHYSAIAQTPVIIERPRVITIKEVIRPQLSNKTQKLFKRLRARKDGLLEKLKLTDKEIRKESISELAGFSYDEKVREALEDILLSDPDPELRIEVARSFAKVTNDKVIAALEKARTEDSEEEVRKEAEEAIKTIRER